MHSTSNQECPLKAGLIVAIYCVLILMLEWSQSMQTEFVLDKTKIQN